ncbi:hypothetical protein [Oceaniglobus trochenteri]|uniref:hypothetical protein n=1 Tax=Oceaniglobus trochenteri TaxID=2763260 RepID=UPI001CFF751A|nr:hypothetical protein [Oceaniglobus trochenteri]
MAKANDPGKNARPVSDREKRLKAALKANLARRKAQARARSEQATKTADDDSAKGE